VTEKRTSASKRWITEPILTGVLGLMLLILWQVAYSWQLAQSGAVPADPFSSGFGFMLQVFLSASWLALPVTAWVVLAIFGNWLARNRGFGARMLMAWCAAVVLAIPPAIYFSIMLSQTDGWDGAGAVAVLVPVLASVLVLPAYATAHVLLNILDSARARRVFGGEVPPHSDAD
jgi:hypothetical protein